MSARCDHLWSFRINERLPYCMRCGTRYVFSDQLDTHQAAMLGFPIRNSHTGLLQADFSTFRRDVLL